MKQTNSTICMLTNAYKAVLVKSYVKRNPSSRINRLIKDVALSFIFSTFFTFSYQTANAENLDSVLADNISKNFFTSNEYFITGITDGVAVKVENGGNVTIGIPLNEQEAFGPNITDNLTISKASTAIYIKDGSVVITLNDDFIANEDIGQGIVLDGESSFKANIDGDFEINSSENAIKILHSSSIDSKESSADINVKGDLKFGSDKGVSSGHVINLDDGGAILDNTNNFLSTLDIDVNGNVLFGSTDNNVSGGISVSGKNSSVDIEAGKDIGFNVKGSDLLRTDSGNIKLDSGEDIIFNVKSQGFTGKQAVGYITTNNSSFAQVGSSTSTHYLGKTSNKIYADGNIILKAINEGSSPDEVMGILGLGADIDFSMFGGPVAKSQENLTELKGNNICLSVINNTGYVEGISAQGSRNVSVNLDATNDIFLNVKANGNDGIGLHTADGNINLISKNGFIKVDVDSDNGDSIGIIADESNGTSSQSIFQNHINLTAYYSNEISADTFGIYTTGADSIVNLNALTDKNIILSDVYSEQIEFGTGIAINAIESSRVNLSAANANSIFGGVYANGIGTSVTLKGLEDTASKSNYVRSYAVIDGAGDLDEDTSGKFDGKSVISALYAQGGANITLKGENDIGTYAIDGNPDQLERTVWAYDGSNIEFDGATTIRTDSYATSKNSDDIAIAAGTGVNLKDISGSVDPSEISRVNINYKDYSNGYSSYIEGDILSAYKGIVDITSEKDADNKSIAGIGIKGNLLSGNNGVLNVELGKKGSLIGRIDDYQDAGTKNEDGTGHLSYYNPAFSSSILSGGNITLDMGEDSTWVVTGQSWVTTLKGDGTIDMRNDNPGDGNAASHAVHVGKLTGDHTFVMDLHNTEHDISDMLYIKDEAGSSGTQTVYLNSVAGLENMQDGDRLRFATVNAGTDKLQFIGKYNGENGYNGSKNRVMLYDTGFNNVNFVIGHEEYDDSKDTENSGYNGKNFDESKPGNAYVDNTYRDGVNWYITKDSSGDEISDGGKTMLNMSRANYSNAIYMDRLNKRLGEARYINGGEDDGLWVRLRHDRIGKDDAFRSQNTMYEVGYDKKQECDNGERRIGMAIDYMHGDTGYSDISGKGEIDRYGLWLYNTWLGDKGHYVDYVAKWGHLSNDFEVYTMTRGEKVSGDYSNNVFSISAEYGRKKDIGNDWYFEPQVQAQLARVTGADYETSQGTKVSVDGINSLIGRAGFRLGKDFGEEKQSTVYLKADVLHEFLGDQDIKAMDDTTNGWQTVSYENEGTWYDVGFGFATQLSKASYAFMDFEKSFGHDNDETYQINVGMQWSF